MLFGKSARQKPPSSNQKRFGQKLPVGKSLPGQIVLYLITRFTPTACSMHYKTVAFPITTMSVRACIISDPMCTRCVHHTAHNNTVRVISISLWPTMATTYNITRTLVTSNHRSRRSGGSRLSSRHPWIYQCIGMQPFSNLSQLSTISCCRKHFMIISQTVQE